MQQREKLVGVASCYDTEWWPGTGDCRRRLPMEPSSSTSQRQPPALLHASLPPVLHHTELLMAPLLPPNTAIATLLVLTGHREYGCSSVPPCPWPAQPATAGSESVANEQQATYHISSGMPSSLRTEWWPAAASHRGVRKVAGGGLPWRPTAASRKSQPAARP